MQLQNIYLTLAWVVCIQLAAWGIGRPLYRLLTGKSEESLTAGLDVVFSAALGYIVLAYSAFALAALHILYPLVIISGTLACALGGAVQLFHLRPISCPTLSWQDIPLLLGIVFLVSHIPNALYPGLIFDDNVYHLLIPRLYIENHGLIYLPSHLFANMPHIVEMLYTVPMAIGDFTAPKVLALAFSFWTIAALYLFALPLLGRFGAGLIPLLYLSGVNIQWHLGLAYIEPAMGFFLLCACLSLLAWHETGNTRFLRILALACGFVMASKYTGWFFVMAILAVSGFLVLRSPGLAAASKSAHKSGKNKKSREVKHVPAPFPPRLRLFSQTALIVLALIAPWLIKNMLFTGNPVYPNLYGIFGGSFWSEIQENSLNRSMGLAGGLHKTLYDYLMLPWRLTFKDFFFSCPSFSISLMILWLIAMIRPSSYRLPQWPLLVISISGFALWAFSVQEGRFLVAWVPVIVLTASFALAPLRNHLRTLIAVFCSILALGVYQITTQLYPHVLHLEVFQGTREQLLYKNFNFDICAILNRLVPEDGKVLALWDNRFFFLNHPFDADNSYYAPTGLARLRAAGSAANFARELVGSGFTHVLLDMQYANKYLNNALECSLIDERVYPETRLVQDRLLFADFMNTYCEPIQEMERWQEFMPNVMICRIKKELFLH